MLLKVFDQPLKSLICITKCFKHRKHGETLTPETKFFSKDSRDNVGGRGEEGRGVKVPNVVLN